MIDTNAAALALRNRLLSLDTLKIATTGSTTLSATVNGFARMTGSFLSDGFADGMEILSSGFGTAGNNGRRVIESVSALSMITTSTATRYVSEGAGSIPQPTVEAPAAARTISAGLPLGIALDNKAFDPKAGRPFVEEDFVPATHTLRSFPAQGGTTEETGAYVVKIYGLEGKGAGAIRRLGDAIRSLFTPGTTMAAGANVVRVRGDLSPQTGQILPQGDGWAVLVITIPWRAYSQNTIAA